MRLDQKVRFLLFVSLTLFLCLRHNHRGSNFVFVFEVKCQNNSETTSAITYQMSSDDRAMLSLLSDIAFSFDGAVLGVALAYAAVRSVLKYAFTTAVLCKLREAPYVRVSDLRSILTVDDSENSNGKLVIVRGVVQEIDGNSKSLGTNALVSKESGDRAVAIQRTLTVFVVVWLLRNCENCLISLLEYGPKKGKRKKKSLYLLH